MGTFPDPHQPCPLTSCISGKRYYYVGSSLVGSWIQYTVTGRTVEPPDGTQQFIALQCNNEKDRRRGNLFMVFYDGGAAADKFQKCSLSTVLPKRIHNMNEVIHLEVGWSLIVIHASNDDKTWFSTLADDALWSKVPAGSLLMNQLFWMPINLYTPTDFEHDKFYFLHPASLTTEGFLAASTESVTQVWWVQSPSIIKKRITIEQPTDQKKKKKRKIRSKKGRSRSNFVLDTHPFNYEVITIYYDSSRLSPLATIPKGKSRCMIYPVASTTTNCVVCKGVTFSERPYYLLVEKVIKFLIRKAAQHRYMRHKLYE